MLVDEFFQITIMGFESLTDHGLFCFVSVGAVEPASGVDNESIEVARECLHEAFKLNTSVADDGIKPASLVDLFSSPELNKLQEKKPDHVHRSNSVDAPGSSAAPGADNANLSKV